MTTAPHKPRQCGRGGKGNSVKPSALLSIDGRPFLVGDDGPDVNLYGGALIAFVGTPTEAEHGERIRLFGRRYEVNQLSGSPNMVELVLLEG